MTGRQRAQQPRRVLAAIQIAWRRAYLAVLEAIRDALDRRHLTIIGPASALLLAGLLAASHRPLHEISSMLSQDSRQDTYCLLGHRSVVAHKTWGGEQWWRNGVLVRAGMNTDRRRQDGSGRAFSAVSPRFLLVSRGVGG